MPASLSIAPTVQTIVVDGVAIVNPQFASIVGENAEAVMPSAENSHTASPSHSEVVTSAKTGPIATCIAIIHHLAANTLDGRIIVCADSLNYILSYCLKGRTKTFFQRCKFGLRPFKFWHRPP